MKRGVSMRQRSRGLFASVGLVVLVLLGSEQVGAVWFNTLDYFETEYPNVCVAVQPNNPGSWSRIDLDESSPCLDDVYHFTKGYRAGYNLPNSQQDAGLWGSESFVVNYYGSFLALRMMNERGVFCSPESTCIPVEIQDEHNPGDPYHRVFRDRTSQEKGAFWMPVFVNGSYSATTHFDLEYWWKASNHNIMCVGNDQVYQEYFNLAQTRSTSGPYSKTSWLQDKRSVSNNKNAWHNVEYIKLVDQWSSVKEEFWYGRWFDPVMNGYRGLGLIHWAWIENGVVKSQSENKYIVDCNVMMDCTGICPP